MSEKTGEVLLSPQDVARMLQVNVRTVQRWAAAGEMPEGKKVGRLLRWRPKIIQDWLNGVGKRREK